MEKADHFQCLPQRLENRHRGMSCRMFTHTLARSCSRSPSIGQTRIQVTGSLQYTSAGLRIGLSCTLGGIRRYNHGLLLFCIGYYALACQYTR